MKKLNICLGPDIHFSQTGYFVPPIFKMIFLLDGNTQVIYDRTSLKTILGTALL